MTISLPIDQDANELLSRDPLALLIGMLLDQQVPLEKAFSGPRDLVRRLGHEPTAEELAGYDPDALAAVFAERPALHRYPKAMAARTQDLARLIVSKYGGDAAQVWQGAGTGQELVRRIAELPGFGPAKAQIFTALLGKQLGVRPARLARGGRAVRPGRLPDVGRRHHRRRLTGRGPRLQTAAQGGGQGRPRLI